MNPVEKRKLDIRNTVTLDNFKSNLLSDGTYTVDEDILTKSYRHLPHHMRDADLTMIAGAYKTGIIACYDNIGNIVDLGFSRNSKGYGYLNHDMQEYDNNIPVLDLFHYNKNTIGYIIENERVRRINNLYSGMRNAITVQKPNTSVTDMTSYTYNGIGRITVNSTTVPTESGCQLIFIPVSVGWVKIRMFIKRFGTIPYNLYFTAGNTPARHLYIDLDNISTGTPTSSGVRNANIYPFKDGYIFEVEANPPGSSRFWFANQDGTNSVNGNGASGIYVGWVTIASETEELNSYIHYQGADYTRGVDTISPITLTQNSIIHIKTVKGIQEFILPSGSFNINDYVVNDKLICFAIKYLPDIEDFINNLTLDGTYTFDDDVIRDSWSDLINRISTNSTLLHQFCNADHIVLPYAYKAGYVAAMDLSDGSIVDIEFERGSKGYGYLNGDMQEYDNNIPVLDLFHYKNDITGYIIENSRGMLLAYPYSSLSTSITNNLTRLTTITNMSSYNWAGVGVATPDVFTNDYARFNLNSMRNGWTKFRIFVKRYGIKDYDLAYQSGNNAFNHHIKFNLTTSTATILNPSNIRSAIIYDYDIYKVLEFESNHTSGRFFFQYNDSDYFDSDGLSGLEMGWLNVALPDTEFNSYIHYQDTNYTRGKDHLKTESYSKICTIGVQTGMKVGSYTDPQTLVQNDKINFILLKQ